MESERDLGSQQVSSWRAKPDPRSTFVLLKRAMETEARLGPLTNGERSPHLVPLRWLMENEARHVFVFNSGT